MNRTIVHFLFPVLLLALLSCLIGIYFHAPRAAVPPKLPSRTDTAIAAKKIVALTFDDGPSAKYTPQILDILKEMKVKATFFVIGRNVVLYPEIVWREVSEGHALGNHSWSHPFMAPIESKKRLSLEITKTDTAIYNAAGTHVSLFRPPHGWCPPWMADIIGEMGYDIINWTEDPHDWKHPKANIIIKRVEGCMGRSAIVLLHDGLELKNDPDQENTVQALREIIADFKADGYQFVTVTQLIEMQEFTKECPALLKVIRKPRRAPH